MTSDQSNGSRAVRKSPGSRSPGSRARNSLIHTDPFFEDSKHHLSLYHGDCLQILAAMPADCVDLIFADPPYFLSNGGITCHAGKMVSVNKGAWDRSRGAAENHEFNLSWLRAAQRVLKPNGSIWVSGTSHVIHSVGFAMQQLEFKLLNDISWVKPNPPPNLSCRYFTHATETIIWAAKNKNSRHTFNYKLMRELNAGKQMKSVWTIPPPESWEKRFGKHPTQKPVALLDRILRASSNEGDLVLDPFAGSGTTILAGLRLHRSTIGIEFEDSSLNLAMRRVVAELVVVQISTVVLKNDPNDLDPQVRFVDRSISRDRLLCSIPRTVRNESPDWRPSENHHMTEALPTRVVHKERNFFFVGSEKREVVFSTAAQSMEEAWHLFHSSNRSKFAILFVIKTETEIYLAT